MNEPRRFLDDTSAPPEVRRLLAAAEHPAVADAARLARSRRRVSALASVPAVGGGLLLLHKLALGALLGSVVGVGVEVGRRVLTTAPPAPSAVVPQVRRTALSSPASPVPAVAPIAPVQAPSAAAPPVHRSASNALSAAPPPSAADVTRELALLEAARHAVTTDPARSLELLEQLARESPRGTLVIERELLVVQALARSGRLEQAQARAARFRAAHPESLYEERITRILEQQGR